MSSLDKDLKTLRTRYWNIVDSKEAFGDGRSVEQALRFWLEHLSSPIIERARQKLEEAGKLPEVDLLVSIAGFAPETTMITVGVFKPQHLLVISSELAYDMIDTIGDFVMKQGLKHSQFRHESCNPNDLSLFEIICQRVRTHREGLVKQGKTQSSGETLVDITGGKKVMSAGAAIAAWELDLRICYIGHDYDRERRAPKPGTEEIVLMNSPYFLYGGNELRRADHDFKMGAFEVARARYEKLAERLNEPARARFLRDLSGFYEAWRNLDIGRLKQEIPKVRERLDEPTPIARNHAPQLKAQLDFVERLVKEDRAARIFTLFLLGDANLTVSRYDFSALLFYRTIEASIASRLEKLYEGFSCEKPDYTKITQDKEGLEKRFETASKEVLGNDARGELPRAIGCIDGTILLRALDDKLLEMANLGEAKALSHLRNLTTTRNRSILAHGYQSVNEKDCKALRATAEKLLAAYWKLNEESTTFEAALKELRFLSLTDD